MFGPIITPKAFKETEMMADYSGVYAITVTTSTYYSPKCGRL
jgi:hypothetical protein